MGWELEGVIAMKWYLRSCPRCGGDLYEDVYSRGEDVVCLQCGMTLDRCIPRATMYGSFESAHGTLADVENEGDKEVLKVG